MSENKYEILFCIINAGFSQVIMEAAKDAGATGGTIIRGRGTANPDAEEFFHINIQPDKEILMILVPSNIKDDVMRSVYEVGGLKTAGQGIVFSMPVSKAVGLPELKQDNQDVKE